MEGPSSLSSWPPRHGTTAPRLPPPDRAARGARSPRTCQCRRTRPLPLHSHAAATAPPSRNERGPPVGLLLMVPPSPHTCKPPQPSTDQRSRVCVTVTARSRLFRYGISLNIFHCLTTCVLRSLRSRPCSLPRKAVPTATSASTARIYRNRPRR
jgi:hypothetical protein